MKLLPRALISALAALALSALLAALYPATPFLTGWLAGTLLLAVAAFCLLSAWQWAGAGKLLAWLVLLAFFLRLGLGVALGLGMPVLGYDEPEQKAGYVFYDAYRRDEQAWDLASQGQPLGAAFSQDFATDQYGGLLALSGLVYRLLSPDAHRPYLILILAAFFAALGLPFLYKGARARWGETTALLSTGILAFYPDSLLLGASQMREPFLIGLICIAFWGVLSWPDPSKRTIALATGASLVGIALFSSRVALPVAGVLAVWFFLDHLYERIHGRWKLLVWGGFTAAGLLLAIATWGWFASSVKWDIQLMTTVSGLSEKAIQQIGDAFRPVFYTIYGVARPLLPAAIATTRPPWIWKTIDISRSLGWYLLAPLLLYSFIALWKEKSPAGRRTLLWFALAVLAWLFISSARAGGDQWDNPRYRTIFLPWIALLAGWALAHRGAWLGRILLIEGIFLAFFTQWYLARYWTWLGWRKSSFWLYPAWILLLSGLVVVGGWWWDRRGARRLLQKKPSV